MPQRPAIVVSTLEKRSSGDNLITFQTETVIQVTDSLKPDLNKYLNI